MGDIVKVIEVIAQSPTSWDDAAKRAVKEAAKTLHGIRSVWVDNFTATVENNKITEYRVNAKISFMLDEKR